MRVFVVALAVHIFLAGAVIADDTAVYACREAMKETIKTAAPKSLRTVVLQSCLAAFADKIHRNDLDKACDRQAKKLAPAERLPAAYTCTAAMMIAYQ